MITRRMLFAAAACAAAPEARAQTEGPPLPPALSALNDLALVLPNGTPTTLGAQLGPGPAIVSFWATWCAPCNAEARHLARLRRDVPAARLNIVGINAERIRETTEAEISSFLQRTGAGAYTQLRATIAAYQAFGNGPTLTLPRLYVFDAQGRPISAFGRYNGAATFRAIDRAVEQALA